MAAVAAAAAGCQQDKGASRKLHAGAWTLQTALHVFSSQRFDHGPPCQYSTVTFSLSRRSCASPTFIQEVQTPCQWLTAELPDHMQHAP
jgi:hypothetical protein